MLTCITINNMVELFVRKDIGHTKSQRQFSQFGQYIKRDARTKTKIK